MVGTSRSNVHLLSILAIALLALVLAACNGDDEVEDSADDVDDIPIETVEPEVPEDTDDTATDDVETDATTSDDEPDVADDATGSERLQQLDLELELFAEGVIQPTDMVAATDGTDRLFVVSRIGTIHVIEDGELREEPFLDLREQIEHEMVEQGMLSMALHPDFAENGYFYVYYITHGDEDTMVSRFQISEDGQFGDPGTETPILEVEQPHYSHNGGNVKFGPDGYLYIGLGDGEDPGDPHENSQDPNTMLGSILRIDVDGGEPYAIPEDNPFVGSDEGLDEVWAYGLRNPWRFSFDQETGDMFMVDVGQWEIEEVNVQPADSSGGENYGWPIMEGDECWEAEECDKEGLTMPAVTYENPDFGCAIIGGYTYHGSAHPELEGIYFFGDWCSGNIWGMVEEDGEWVKEIVIESDLMINAFGLDHNGEIYALDFEEGGGIYRVTAN
jgi:glucose/arabinose dehydrogenase